MCVSRCQKWKRKSTTRGYIATDTRPEILPADAVLEFSEENLAKLNEAFEGVKEFLEEQEEEDDE